MVVIVVGEEESIFVSDVAGIYHLFVVELADSEAMVVAAAVETIVHEEDMDCNNGNLRQIHIN